MAQQVYKVMQSSLAKNRDVLSISIFVEDEWYYVGNANRSYDASLLEQVQFDPLKNQNGSALVSRPITLQDGFMESALLKICITAPFKMRRCW